jgi:signal transduction histidine kinase/streptogramin lyase
MIMQSDDGALWIAGQGTEICRVDYETPRWLTLQDLNFHWESAANEEWFLHRSGRVVVRGKEGWMSYGSEDGLIDAPVALLGTGKGEVWIAGSHEGTAATARFDGQRWQRHVHGELSWGVDWRGAFESSDGSLWFSAAVDSRGPRAHRAGILQYRGGTWVHHHQPGRAPSGADDQDVGTLLPPTERPEPIGKFLCVGESQDGRIWAGRNMLAFFSGREWSLLTPPPELHSWIIETLYTTSERQLWIGTRQYGALLYDPPGWKQFQGKDSLVANGVRGIVQTADGSIWMSTDRDISRFDGQTWTADVVPAQLSIAHEGGSLRTSRSGRLWINHFEPNWVRRAWSRVGAINTSNCVFRTTRHHFHDEPPETYITPGPAEIPQPGNVSVYWSGADRWREPKAARLQFSFRLDAQPWSKFTDNSGQSFFSLPGGAHRLEVRARDRGFNVDPTPAVMEFAVLPPVWRQSWFILLMFVLVGLVIAQSIRVLLERGSLRRANRALAGEIQVRERTEDALRRLNLELDQRVRERTIELEAANKELEAFSYSVSHDLRAPLRRIEGCSRAVLEDCADRLDSEGKQDLEEVRAATRRMGQLIDDMLRLARVTRADVHRERVDLSALAEEVMRRLRGSDQGRVVEAVITPGLVALADPRLMRIALENLLGNAWKFTGKQSRARIEFGEAVRDGVAAYYVRDNGAGFDMQYAEKLFGPFQRLHTADQFPGTGVGLATVQRIIHRLGGRIWAESAPGEGASFYFTLWPKESGPAPGEAAFNAGIPESEAGLTGGTS